MKRLFAAFAAAALCLAGTGVALAQQYKWVDQDGRVRYGDVPPPGVKAQRLNPPASGPTPAPAAKKGDKADKPLSPEAAFRKRQEDAEKDRQKEAQDQQAAAARRDNCARAQEQLRQIESGQRIARTDSKGEPYFLEDAQVAREATRARQIVQQSCG